MQASPAAFEHDPPASGPTPGRPGGGAERLSRGLAVAGLVTAWALGTRRYALDASLWESEAFIAWSVLGLPAGDLFGELLTPHSFPRLYLFAIAGLKNVFGYETAVLRFLPWLAFMAGMALFVRGLYARFRTRPALLFLALALLIAVPVPPAFAAMVKQYSLDMTLALLILVLPDAFLEQRLGRGRRIGTLAILPLPILLSYPYVIALAARLGAWWLAAGLRGRWRIDARGTALVGVTTAAALGTLWWTDLRHTADVEGLFRFWDRCIVEASGSNAPGLLARLLTDWWCQHLPWGPESGRLGEAGHASILAAYALGVIAVVRGALGRPTAAPTDAAAFGSRALANVLVPLVLLAAAWLTQYPLCANRLTLFALYPITMVALEGVGLVSSWIERSRWGGRAAVAFVLGLGIAVLPAAGTNVMHQWREPGPADIRRYVALLDETKGLPIFVPACSTVQVKALPELRDRHDILFYDDHVMPSTRGRFPEADRFIMLSAGTHFLCPWFFERLSEAGFRQRELEPPVGAAGIWVVEKMNPRRSRLREQRLERRARNAEAPRADTPQPEAPECREAGPGRRRLSKGPARADHRSRRGPMLSP